MPGPSNRYGAYATALLLVSLVGVLTLTGSASAATSSLIVRSGQHWIQPLGPRDGAFTFQLITPPAEGNGYGTVEGLWHSDGTAAGTVPYVGDRLLGQTVDHLPVWGAKDDQVASAVPPWLTLGVGPGAAAWFTIDDDQLWKTDGTGPGTVLVKQLPPDWGKLRISGFFAIDDRTYFLTDDAISHDVALWKTDGTPDGTTKIIVLGGGYYHQPSPVTVYRHAIWFTQDGRLRRTDGTPGDETDVADARTEQAMVVFNDLLTMAGDSAIVQSDGTAAHTAAIVGTPPLQEIANLTVAGTELFFTATGDAGDELFVSDGTGAGTHLIADLAAGTASSSPSDLIAAGNSVYFRADDGIHGRALWRSDGTQTGTELISSGPAGPAWPDGYGVWFTQADGLWRSPAADDTALPLSADDLVARRHPTVVPPGDGSTPLPRSTLTPKPPAKTVRALSASDLRALIGRRLVARHGRIALGTITCPVICARVTAIATSGKTKFASGSARVTAGRRVRLQLKLTRAGRRVLTHRRHLPLHLTLRTTGTGGKTLTVRTTRTCGR